MTDYLSSEESWRGQFWLPGQSGENDQHGILSYSPKVGVTLSLIGGFDDRRWTRLSSGSYSRSGGSSRFPIIHGVAGGKPVTLLDCRATRSRGMLSQVEEQEIRAQRALMGVLLDDPEAMAFSELSIELENLAEWDHRNDVVIHFDPDATRWQIAVDPVEPLTVKVDDLTIELVRWHPKPSFVTRRDRVDVPTVALSYLTIGSAQPRSIAQWGDMTKVFQDLLTLAMDAPCAVLSETLTPSDALRDNEEAESRAEIAVYMQHIAVGDPDARGVINREALFTLGTEGVDFHSLVPLWLTVNTRFRVACDLILGAQYVERGYLQPQLITAVAAAEALHEALELGPPMPKDEFNALKASLLDCVPENRKQWLREKLGHNTRTLRTKLLDLTSAPDPEVMAALLPNGYRSACP